MNKLSIIILFLALGYTSVFSNSIFEQDGKLTSFLFESQDFLFVSKSHDAFLKDKAKFWKKDYTKKSHYFHQSGESLLFINYLEDKKTRVTKIIKGRPARLRSIVISDNQIESVYQCEVRLAPGIFSPSGIKSFYCDFITPKTCQVLKEVSVTKSTPVFPFVKSLIETLPQEKMAYADVYLPTFRFLLDTQEVSDSDLQIEEYRDSYRSLCMGLRLQIGAKVRFKYDQDAEYEEKVCLDHSASLIDTKPFEMSHKRYCESMNTL